MKSHASLRSFFAFLIIGALIVQGSGRLFILINFKLHQAYIASVLCENRDKPEMQCNGNCHLKKELRKNDEREQKQQPPNLELREVLWVLPVCTSFDLSARCALATYQKPSQPKSKLQRGKLPAIFHPPKCTA